MVSEKELSRRIKAYRLAYPLTQKELAAKTGLSLRSIQNFEDGRDVNVSTLLAIIEYLGLGENLMAAIPDMEERPSAMILKAKGQTKQRVRKKKAEKNIEFRWGDEQ